MKYILLLIFMSPMLLGLSSCGSMVRHQDEIPVAATSGVTGDAQADRKARNTAMAAIHGNAVGGPAGDYIRNQMDKETAELNKQLAFGHAQRVDEGIVVIVPSSMLFDRYGAVLRDTARAVLSRAAGILKKYSGTDLLIEGHTDSVGSFQYNLELTKRQAEAVGNYLVSKGVAAGRLTLVGYGGSEPIDSNDEPGALEANRRIEMAILAGEQLKAEATAKR